MSNWGVIALQRTGLVKPVEATKESWKSNWQTRRFRLQMLSGLAEGGRGRADRQTCSPSRPPYTFSSLSSSSFSPTALSQTQV